MSHPSHKEVNSGGAIQLYDMHIKLIYLSLVANDT